MIITGEPTTLFLVGFVTGVIITLFTVMVIKLIMENL